MTKADPDRAAARRDLLIIRNPAAGQRRAGLYARTLAALEGRGCRVTVRDTTGPGGPGAAEALAREAATGEFEAVVVAGGDGTVNEAVNGLAGAATPLGLIPLGTANVLAAEIGWPASPTAIAEALAAGLVRPVRIGRANGRAFMVPFISPAGPHTPSDSHRVRSRLYSLAAVFFSASDSPC